MSERLYREREDVTTEYGDIGLLRDVHPALRGVIHKVGYEIRIPHMYH